MRLSAVVVSIFIPNGTATLHPAFLIEFSNNHRYNPPTDSVDGLTCSGLWRDHIVSRKYLYRLDAHLVALQDSFPSEAHRSFNPSLVMGVDPSIDALGADAWQVLADVSRAIELGMNRHIDYASHSDHTQTSRNSLSEVTNLEVIRHARSLIRLAEDLDPEHVPLFETDSTTGFPNGISYEALTQIIIGLRGVRSVVTGDLPDTDKRASLDHVMTAVQETIRMMARSHEHAVGSEFRLTNSRYSHPRISFPRSCRVSDDPILEIERLTEDVISSLDFCRGLLFRFVPRASRDSYMESLYEVYELLEQQYIENRPTAIHNVRLVWVDRGMELVRDLLRIRLIYLDTAEMSRWVVNDLTLIIQQDILERVFYRSTGNSESSEIYDELSSGDLREALGAFLTAAQPILDGREYLSVDEAIAFVATARVAYARAMQSNVAFESTSVDFPPLSMGEFIRLIGAMEQSRASLADTNQSIENMTGSVIIKTMFSSVAGLRWLASHVTEVGELTTLKILSCPTTAASVADISTEISNARGNLISFWENYSGSDSGSCIKVILDVTDLRADSDALSAVVLRVMETDKFRELVEGIILSVHQGVSPAINDEATEAIRLITEGIDEELFVLSNIALRSISASYCEGLRNAREVLDEMSDSRLATAAEELLISNCPQLGALTDRAATLRVPSRVVHKLHVERAHVLGGAIQWFGAMNGLHIRSGEIEVFFLGEEGSDAGGLRREWFYLVGREIVNDGIMIETEPHSGRLLPNSIGENNMEFVGKFIAKAIRDGQRVPIRFAKVIYRYILEGLDNVEFDLDMYTEQSPDHGRSLRWILDNNESSEGWEEATRDLSFSVDIVELGVHRVHDLIVGGSHIRVSQENKEEYVQRVIEFKMRDAFRPQIESFLAGFFAVLPHDDVMNLFTPEELEMIIAGRPELDVADLREHTTYISYSDTDQPIVWFWEVVENFDQDQLALLLQFSSGTPLAPVGGFASLPFKIARVGLHENPANNPLPSAHTCLNQLDLPAYTSKDELKDKLLRSISLGSEGFGFA
jgi:hypothetical protein